MMPISSTRVVDAPTPLVAVVGGGPAGLLAAQRLAEAGYQVRVFEQKATVGRKFLVAGHGGFNLTNSEDIGTFASHYGAAAGFFQEALAYFSPQDLRRWAAELGIATFVGTSGRVFPEAQHTPADLLRAWLRRLRELGVGLHVRHRWLGFVGDNGLRFLNEAANEEFVVEPAATVLALGGASWPQTGSDGHWTSLLAAIGVPCQPFAPSNCGAEVGWSAFFKEKVGRAPLKNIALSCDGQTVRGEIMLTDYGLEGTPVYALTPALRAALAAGGPTPPLQLNLKPDLAPDELLRRLARRRPGTSLAAFLASALHLKPPVPTLLRELALPGADLLSQLTALPIPVAGLRPLAEAISSAGGVGFAQVDEHLMLRQRPGTFVAGEMLDWEAPTGGYLLQGCFSTGAWVAQAISGRLRPLT